MASLAGDWDSLQGGFGATLRVLVQPLFVYGSLKRGHRHHRMLAGAERLGEARTSPGYRLVRYGAYPALVAGGAGVVSGELYLVTAELLVRLDEFEGCPDLYQRGLVLLGDGSEAITYLMDARAVQGRPEVAGGVW